MPWPERKISAPEVGDVQLEWLNGGPLSMRMLKGHVVLVHFFDYASASCLRALPYISGWVERYSSFGLATIGVHSPEFSFGRNSALASSSIKDLGVSWPVILDGERFMWRRYANHLLPALNVIDKNGILRFYRTGEGEYEATEIAIQLLLREIDSNLGLPQLMSSIRSSDSAWAASYPATPDVYLGTEKGYWEKSVPSDGKPHHYFSEKYPREAVPSLGGNWRIMPDHVSTTGEKGERNHLLLRYKAKEVNLVMSSGSEREESIELQIDGKPLPKEHFGTDVVAGGPPFVRVGNPRMYSLTKHPNFEQHTLKLVVTGPGWKGYVFTFATCTPWDEQS
jgi:hypothetical protein